MKEVTIIKNDSKFDIYEESGQAVEVDFDSYQSAKQYAIDQNWKIVSIFFHSRNKK